MNVAKRKVTLYESIEHKILMTTNYCNRTARALS